ncbi:MAG: DUF502 domain-containing protein [Lentisphaerae bacterium]|nr:DUF502 domain-containing protein [Lentisphaerota bacterium]
MKIFLRGLLAILPISICVFFIYWIVTFADSKLGALLKLLLPDRWYFPGLGLLAGLGLIFVAGLLFNTWLFQRLLSLVEDRLGRIPLVKTIFGSIKDLLAFFAKDGKKAEAKGVVLVTVNNAQMLGIVTRDDLSGLAGASEVQDRIAVYLPMSYQMGGFTVFVPRSAVRPLAMSVEDAMRFAMTAGMSMDAPPAK